MCWQLPCIKTWLLMKRIWKIHFTSIVSTFTVTLLWRWSRCTDRAPDNTRLITSDCCVRWLTVRIRSKRDNSQMSSISMVQCLRSLMLCGVWISKDMYSGELENKESLVYEATTLWLDWIYYIGYFSGTILVVTAINILTLGIHRTCIILRHIPSWFDAVLAIAILQSCVQGGPKWLFWGQKWQNVAGLSMCQSDLRGSKMIPND